MGQDDDDSRLPLWAVLTRPCRGFLMSRTTTPTTRTQALRPRNRRQISVALLPLRCPGYPPPVSTFCCACRVSTISVPLLLTHASTASTCSTQGQDASLSVAETHYSCAIFSEPLYPLESPLLASASQSPPVDCSTAPTLWCIVPSRPCPVSKLLKLCWLYCSSSFNCTTPACHEAARFGFALTSP